MALKIIIETDKPDFVEEKLKMIEEETLKKAVEKRIPLSASFIKQDENKFILAISYPMQNPIADRLLVRDLRNRFKTFDELIKIEKA